MDRFYLRNKALYQKLVDEFDASRPVPHFSRHTVAALPVTSQDTTRGEHRNLVVTARIRPMLQIDVEEGFPCAIYPRKSESGRSKVVDIHDLYNHPRGRPQLRSAKYSVDQVFDKQATTQEIYRSLVVDLVSFSQSGGIATLLAYGQTGSGKTFTISELQKLAVATLIEDALSTGETELYITISDLAGNAAFDLLDSRKPLSVLEDGSGTTHLAGAVECRLTSTEQAMDVVDQAASFRRTESTKKNDASSRSHSICRVRIVNPDSSEGILYLVDLAGSEAARDVAEHGADRMREAKEINISLSVLKDCLRGRTEIEVARQEDKNKKVHIPTRRSTLTRVLKHVFDPDENRGCKTIFIACVNPSLADVNASKNTLRYAEMLART